MRLKPSISIVTGTVSIAFSSLCFLVMPVFTPGIVLAGLVGAVAGVIALVGGARRTALVTLTFAITPTFGFLLLEYDPPRFNTGYLAFIALGVALVVAFFAFVDYSREGANSP
jgi:hypothetical protein